MLPEPPVLPVDPPNRPPKTPPVVEPPEVSRLPELALACWFMKAAIKPPKMPLLKVGATPATDELAAANASLMEVSATARSEVGVIPQTSVFG